MRFVLLALLCGLLAASAGATTIVVPDEDLGITAIQHGVDLAAPGDTVLIMSGTYDSVHTFNTPLGRRDAIVQMADGITLIGDDRGGVRIDFLEAEYGILCSDVGPETVIANLTILGGASRDKGRTDDGDGRFLAAGICCLDAASPTIIDVDIENGATGLVVRTQPGNDDSAPTLTGVVVARGSHHGLYVYGNGETPVVVDRCTFVDNYDYGIYAYQADVEVSNSAITHNGKYGLNAYQGSMAISYCNVYWNDEMFPDPGIGSLNYGGDLTDQTGVDGNISEEPYYCDFTGISGYDYHVCYEDPVSPHYQAGEGGVTIGAYDGVCTGCISPVREVSWGAIKALYSE